jgi:hypothetical protein
MTAEVYSRQANSSRYSSDEQSGGVAHADVDEVRLGEIRRDKGSRIILTPADLLYLSCTCTQGFYRFSPIERFG